MRFPKKTLILTIITALVLFPSSGSLIAMTVPSQTAESPAPQSEPEAGGYYYYYNTHDRLLLFLETALYIGLAVGALIILDQHTDDLTIIVYD